MAGKRVPARAVLLLAAAAALASPAARADQRTDLPPGDPSATAPAWPLLRELKELQVIQFQEGMRARIARAEQWRAAGARPRRWIAHRPPRDRSEAGGPQGTRVARRAAPPAELLGPVPPDYPVNRRTADFAQFSTQSEASVGGIGSRLVAAWNDGEGTRTGTSEMGYGWSIDDGKTWTDGGELPLGGGVAKWLSDPVVAVDEQRGWFYVCGIVITSATQNGLAVVRGRFDDAGFAWETPMVARAVRDTFLDKPWIAADSSSGRVHMSYTSFFRVNDRQSDQIEYQVAAGPDGPWSATQVLSSPTDRGLVQGSRPAVGPDGEVHVVWIAVDTTASSGGVDHIRSRTSVDGGATFGPSRDAATLYANFGSGAPGFNRGNGLTFPGIAVDRTRGPYRGRVYVTWHESVAFYRAVLDTTAIRREREPNDAPHTATPFAVGEMVRGAIESPNDVDHFVLNASQGRTVILYMDSLATDLDVSLRLLCADGFTRMAFSAPSSARRRFIVFTLPLGAPWLVRVTPNTPATGAYRFRTAFYDRGTERARDHRDVFVAWADPGGAFGAPVRMNDDPPHFDDWLPEVAVAGDGTVYALWYDWSEGLPESCGGVSTTFLARSWTGGETWNPIGPISSLRTEWSRVSSNIAPNQGDYLGLFANDVAVHAVWADGRHGDPDVFGTTLPLPAPIEGAVVEARPGLVRLAWQLTPDAGNRAGVQRRNPGADWTFLGSADADPSGVVGWSDDTVTPATPYEYRLILIDGGVLRPAGLVTVQVPGVPGLAIQQVAPNPTPGPLRVRFTLPSGAPATLELLDLAGRSLKRLSVGGNGAGSEVVDLAPREPLRPGIYVVRLEQEGRSVATRVAVVP